MLNDPGLYGPRRPLPLRVRPVPGESTGSFVNRLAHANGLSLAAFLDRVGQGEASAYTERVEKYPQSTEMYVNEAGLHYLAVLADRAAGLLQQDLPSLGAEHLLPGPEAAQWRWRWEPVAGAPRAVLPAVCRCPGGRRGGVADVAGQLAGLSAARLLVG